MTDTDTKTSVRPGTQEYERFNDASGRVAKVFLEWPDLPARQRYMLLEGLSFLEHYYKCLAIRSGKWPFDYTGRWPSMDVVHPSRFRSRLFLAAVIERDCRCYHAVKEDIYVLYDTMLPLDDEFVGTMMARSIVEYPALLDNPTINPGPESEDL